MISSRLFSQRITRSSHSSISRITYWTRTLTTTTWTGTCTTTTKTTATANVLIVGGGPVGCSTAYHLALSRQGDGRGIVVLEKDATYAQASATLSAGGIRQQFSLLQNVQMSLYGMEFLRHAHEWLSINNDNNNKNDKNKNNKKKNKTEQQDHNIVNVQLEEHGYLFLASSEQGRLQMLQNHVTQRAAGATTIDLLTPEQLRMEFPWLDTSNLVLGSFGRSGEGWFDPWSLIQGLKRKCQAMGVTFVNGTPLGSIRERHALTGNVIQQQTIRAVHVLEYPSSKNQVTTTTTTGTTKTYTVDYVVNAAGPHCRSVLNLLAGAVAEEEEGGRLRYPLPVQPRKRCIFYVHCPKAETISKTNNRWIAPLTICPKTGVYFRSASVATSAANSHGSDGGGGGGYFLCGVSPQPDQDPNVYVEPTTTTTTQRQGDDDKINNNHHNYYMSTTITTPTAQDYETLFEETIWPAMYNLVPDYFDELKVHSSWAGLYECKYIKKKCNLYTNMCVCVCVFSVCVCVYHNDCVCL